MTKFPKSDRFEYVRRLGAGGMGVVFEALDRRRELPIALKTLASDDPSLLYRLKREFRSLADLRHPNLVTLYELISVEQTWFFTMELIRGVEFLDHVRGHGSARWGPVDTGATSEKFSYDAFEARETLDEEPEAVLQPRGFDEGKLRDALGQLVQALLFLHGNGKIHRDIKPSNVLVEQGGHLKLLDFGIIADVSEQDQTARSTGARIVGTASYMAPEQPEGPPVSPAADWYAVGVMLYEALTGRLPFTGSVLQVLLKKQTREPPPLSGVEDAGAADLASLCLDLLVRDPAQRPTGDRIAARLGLSVPGPGVSSRRGPMGAAPGFVGRARELALLSGAFEAAGGGRGGGALISGPSGIGKTRLVGHFLTELRRSGALRARPWIFSGRCISRETVPYKAFDGIIDEISHTLIRMDEGELRRTLPADFGFLAELFPVLRRLPDESTPDHRTVNNPQERRARGFLALRSLLSTLSESRPLILFIDDLQWIDRDSIELLEDLLRPPGAPPLFLVACHRADEGSDPSHLARLLPVLTQDHGFVELDVGPLTDSEVRELARRWLDREGGPVGDALWEDSGGNPFFVEELCRYLQTREGGVKQGSDRVGLEEALWSRIETQDEPARRVLGVLAQIRVPVPRSVLQRALDLSPSELEGLLATLKGECLVRTVDRADTEFVDLYHDRIRGALAARQDPERSREVHEHLALVLERWEDAPVAELISHWRHAGQPDRALTFATMAAQAAEEKLAFERATSLYRAILELDTVTDEPRRHTLRALGDCLVNTGRGAEAAEAYFAAAEGAGWAQRHELRRRGATQLLTAGHLAEGLQRCAEVLGEIGVAMPTSMTRAALTMLYHRVVIRLRGLRWTERDEQSIDAQALARCDTLWAMAMGLAAVEPILSTLFSWQSLRLALRLGEPRRVAEMLLGTGAQLSLMGSRKIGRARRHLDRAMLTVLRLDQPRLQGVQAMAEGIVAFNAGEWRRAQEKLDRAERLLNERIQDAWHFVTITRQQLLLSLFAQGLLDQLRTRRDRYLRDAELRKDLSSVNSIKSRLGILWLAQDDPDAALEEQEDLLSRWPTDRYTAPHGWALYSQVAAHLYRGDHAAAERRYREVVPLFWASTFRFVQGARCEVLYWEGAIALTAAQTGERRAHHLAVARRAARRMERERISYGRYWAMALRAGVAHLGGDADATVALLTEAEGRLKAADTHLRAACARRCRGERVGGNAGAVLIREADEWMAGVGIQRPDRMVRLFYPGFE